MQKLEQEAFTGKTPTQKIFASITVWANDFLNLKCQRASIVSCFVIIHPTQPASFGLRLSADYNDAFSYPLLLFSLNFKIYNLVCHLYHKLAATAILVLHFALYLLVYFL